MCGHWFLSEICPRHRRDVSDSERALPSKRMDSVDRVQVIASTRRRGKREIHTVFFEAPLKCS